MSELVASASLVKGQEVSTSLEGLASEIGPAWPNRGRPAGSVTDSDPYNRHPDIDHEFGWC